MKTKTTRRALVMSALSLMLCVCMLIGTTFAWFTDSVTSGRNIIQSGNLDVVLEYWDATQEKYVEVDKNTKLFNDAALWEPGYTEVAYLKVSNAGSLALKYQLAVSIYNETTGLTKDGQVITLSDHLQFKVVDSDTDLAGTYASREAAQSAPVTATKLQRYNSQTRPLDAKNEAGDNNFYDYVALIIYMPETVGNEANHDGKNIPSIEMGVNLYATQQMEENDSFGNNYDENAWVDGFDVYSAQDLQAAINSDEANIDLMANIDLTETLVIPADAAPTLNLNGKTIAGTVGRDAEDNRIHVIVNNGNLKLKNGTVNSAGNDGGSAIYNAEGATLTLENVTALGAPQENNVYPVQKYPSYAINNYGTLTVNGATIKSYHGAIATGANGTAVINDATIDVGMGTSTGITSYAFYAFDNGQVTINGGNFAFTKQEVYVNGGNMFCELGSKSIIVNGGNFNGGGFSRGDGREYVINGGTFSFNPSDYVSTGYKTFENNGKYIVASEKAVTNTDALVAAINSDEEVIEVLPGEYTLRFTNNTSFNVNNTTIKGLGEVKLAVSSSEVWYGRVQGSNVTFENIHFIGNVGSTGKATYNNCIFDGWAICASSNKEQTIFNNCTINGCMNTSTDLNSGDVFASNCKIAKAEYSGSMTMNFENCEIGEMIIWNANTNLTNCDVTTLDQSNVTSAVVRINGIQKVDKAVQNVPAAPYKGELYAEGTNAVSYKDMEMTGNAYISIDTNAPVAMENVKSDVNGSVIVMEQYQPAIYIYGSEFTIDEGEYLIDASKVDGGVYQIFLVNVKVNGEYLTQESAAKYLNNVNWFQALQDK